MKFIGNPLFKKCKSLLRENINDVNFKDIENKNLCLLVLSLSIFLLFSFIFNLYSNLIFTSILLVISLVSLILSFIFILKKEKHHLLLSIIFSLSIGLFLISISVFLIEILSLIPNINHDDLILFKVFSLSIISSILFTSIFYFFKIPSIKHIMYRYLVILLSSLILDVLIIRLISIHNPSLNFIKAFLVSLITLSLIELLSSFYYEGLRSFKDSYITKESVFRLSIMEVSLSVLFPFECFYILFIKK